MPYVWAYPDIFLEYKGIQIYYIYRNDQESEGVRTYWFGYSEESSDDGVDDFDVRDFKSYNPDLSLEDNIKGYIDRGELTQDGPTADSLKRQGGY